MKNSCTCTTYFKAASKCLGIFLLGLSLVAPVAGQADELVMKAAFLERFTRFVEWPESKMNELTSFQILVLGNHPFGSSLETLFASTRIKKKDVEFVYSDKIHEFPDCHMAFVSSSCDRELNDIKVYARDHDILTVSDSKDFCEKGMMINLIVEADILKFEINIGEIRKTELRISDMLVSVAQSTLE